jgi:hypothetical protein
MFDYDELAQEMFILNGIPPLPKRCGSTAELALWFARFARACRGVRLIGCDTGAN